MSRPLRFDRWGGLLVAGLVLVGTQQVVDAALIRSKAALAQRLIDNAWSTSLASGERVRPWPWADTWPVARLSIPARRVDLPVLHGAPGNALAFAPGHESASAVPGEPGLIVIAGHRDTHFAFIGELTVGDRLSLQARNGQWRHYRLSSLEVVDSAASPPPPADAGDGLLLVTCYPLDAIRPGRPLRYLAFATPETVSNEPPAVQPRRSYQL